MRLIIYEVNFDLVSSSIVADDNDLKTTFQTNNLSTNNLKRNINYRHEVHSNRVSIERINQKLALKSTKNTESFISPKMSYLKSS
jgi:hypothetical protein